MKLCTTVEDGVTQIFYVKRLRRDESTTVGPQNLTPHLNYTSARGQLDTKRKVRLPPTVLRCWGRRHWRGCLPGPSHVSLWRLIRDRCEKGLDVRNYSRKSRYPPFPFAKTSGGRCRNDILEQNKLLNHLDKKFLSISKHKYEFLCVTIFFISWNRLIRF